MNFQDATFTSLRDAYLYLFLWIKLCQQKTNGQNAALTLKNLIDTGVRHCDLFDLFTFLEFTNSKSISGHFEDVSFIMVYHP